MKRSKTIRVQTTLGELVSVLCEETQNFFNFKRARGSWSLRIS